MVHYSWVYVGICVFSKILAKVGALNLCLRAIWLYFRMRLFFLVYIMKRRVRCALVEALIIIWLLQGKQGAEVEFNYVCYFLIIVHQNQILIIDLQQELIVVSQQGCLIEAVAIWGLLISIKSILLASRVHQTEFEVFIKLHMPITVSYLTNYTRVILRQGFDWLKQILKI